MKSMRLSLSNGRSLWEWLRSLETEDVRRARPFYWFMLLFIAIIYLWVVIADPTMRQPVRLVAFTFLVAVHAGLHWISLYLGREMRRIVPYLVAQGALVMAIGLVANTQGIVLGLYMAMMGESVGLLERPRPTALALLFFFGLMTANSALLWGWGSLPTLMSFALPMAVFVVVYVYMYIREASARDRAQELLRELEVAHRQLAEYSEQVETLTLAAERQRMARELHDTLSQGLAGLILQLEALEAHLGLGNVQRAGAIAGQAKDRARGALAEARRTIDDLRSQPDPSGTLEKRLLQEAERFSAATGIPCAVDLPDESRLTPAREETMLRCVTEGLANIARHARASHASVTAFHRDGDLLVEIHDDGAGFDPAAVDGQAGHYGLLGMRERARLAGGSLEVRSAPGRGTTIRLTLPAREGGVEG